MAANSKAKESYVFLSCLINYPSYIVSFEVLRVSSLENEGIDDLWDSIEEYLDILKACCMQTN